MKTKFTKCELEMKMRIARTRLKSYVGRVLDQGRKSPGGILLIKINLL